MFQEFIIQGYTIAGLVLILQHLLHTRYKESYMQLIKIANRLVWLYSLLMLLLMILGIISINLLTFTSFDPPGLYTADLLNILLLLFFPFGAIVIAPLFWAIRYRPFWLFSVYVVLLNLSRKEFGSYNSWLSLVYGLLFYVLAVLLQVFSDWLTQRIQRADNNTLPDRI